MSTKKKQSETPAHTPTAPPNHTQNNFPEGDDVEIKPDKENFPEPFFRDIFIRKDEFVGEELCPEEEEQENNSNQAYALEGKEAEFKVTHAFETVSLRKSSSPRTSYEDSVSQIPISQSSSLYMMMPTFDLKSDGNLPTVTHQSTQTEWFYQSESTLSKVKLKSDQGSETMIIYDEDLEEDNEDENERKSMESVSETTLFKLMEDPFQFLADEDMDEDFVEDTSYQTEFRKMLKEMALQSEMEEDIRIPITEHLESETRRKQGMLLKKNFEKYKKTILWLMKKRKKLSTFTFRLLNQKLPEIKESEIAEIPQPHHLTMQRTKKVELDVEWMTKKTRVHEGDGNIILYSNGTVFQVLFPDGTGQIHYPSGNLAMLFLRTSTEKFTYIILEDCREGWIRALINNSGHATFYDENNGIWLNLSFNLGYYFMRGRGQKAWNWWNLKLHSHAPPVQPICLTINQHIEVQIRSQDKLFFNFITQKQHIHINLGTKYKYVTPEVLNEMKNKGVQEVDFGVTAKKIQILLGKISKILRLLSIFDLENFVESTMALLENTFPKKTPRFSTLPKSFSSLY